MSRKPVFHVQQFDAFWSLDIDQAVTFLEAGIRGEAYDLDDGSYKRIKKPSHVTKDRATGHYDDGGRNNLFNMPCDWDAEEFEYHLERLREDYGKYLASK